MGEATAGLPCAAALQTESPCVSVSRLWTGVGGRVLPDGVYSAAGGRGPPSLAWAQRPWQGRHLGDPRTPIREAGPPQSLGVTGAQTEVMLRAERLRCHEAASLMEVELHAARGL